MATGQEKGTNSAQENDKPDPRREEEMPERHDPLGRGEDENEFEEIDDVDIDEFQDDEDEGDY